MKQRTIDEMEPDERFRFEYSLNKAELSAAGMSESDYVQSRRVDWGLESAWISHNTDENAPVAKPLAPSAPSHGVGSDDVFSEAHLNAKR